jgi:hypothetical protein
VAAARWEEDVGVGIMRPSETRHRWVRTFRAGMHLVYAVDGFNWDKPEKQWKVAGILRVKVERWMEIERGERKQKEERRMWSCW